MKFAIGFVWGAGIAFWVATALVKDALRKRDRLADAWSKARWRDISVEWPRRTLYQTVDISPWADQMGERVGTSPAVRREW